MYARQGDSVFFTFLFPIVMLSIFAVAFSSMGNLGAAPDGIDATAVVIPIVFLLQFISGVYLQFSMLPDWLQNFASIFPLKWMAQGMRAVFLPESFAVLEQTENRNLLWVAINMGVWFAIGLLLVRLTFRWIRKDA